MRALKITQSITTRETESFNKYLKDVSGLDMINPETEVELCRELVLLLSRVSLLLNLLRQLSYFWEEAHAQTCNF
jgi:hypothetical protein